MNESPLKLISGMKLQTASVEDRIKHTILNTQVTHRYYSHEWLKLVRKASSETVNNSATLQNDDELFVSIGQDQIWHIYAFLHYTSNSTADIKFGWAYSGTLTGAFPWGQPPTITTLGTGVGLTVAVAGTNREATTLEGLINCNDAGVTGGTLTLQWAQGTATVVNTILGANSFLLARRIK